MQRGVVVAIGHPYAGDDGRYSSSELPRTGMLQGYRTGLNYGFAARNCRSAEPRFR